MKRWSRRRALGLGAVGAVALAAACGDQQPTRSSVPQSSPGPLAGGTFRSLLDEDPASLDPITPSGGVGPQVGAFAYSRLVRFAVGTGRWADGTLEGDLAQRWEQPDPDTLIFHLRADARFDPRPPTTGRAVRAEDVLATWDAFATRGTYRNDLAHSADRNAPILSLRATDSRTLTLALAGPDAQLLPTLASRFGLWVLPTEAFTVGFDPATEMRGSGPWLLTRYRPAVGFHFERHPAAHTPTLLDGVELPIIADAAFAETQFRARAIHGGPALGGSAVAGLNALAVKAELADTRIDLHPPPLVGPTLAFGWRGASPFRDTRVRLAVSMLIDRDLFIEAFNNLSKFQRAGVPMTASYTTPMSAAWGPYWLDPTAAAFGPAAQHFRLNVAEARKLLAAAGYPDGLETPFTFIGGSNWGRDWGRRAEVLMAMLGQGGIRCRANVVDYNGVFIPQYLRKAGDFEGIAMQRTGSRGDPGQWWSIFFSSSGANSQTGTQFPRLDALILAQRREMDRAKRIAAIHDLQRSFASEMPAVPQGGHTEEPLVAWRGLRGPDSRYTWGGGDLGAEAYPAYWLEPSLRG